jgi:hypothetical protein
MQATCEGCRLARCGASHWLIAKQSPPGRSQRICRVTVKRIWCKSDEDHRRARITMGRVELARSSELGYGKVFDGG